MPICPRCGAILTSGPECPYWPCAERGRALIVSDEDVTIPEDKAPTGGLMSWDF